MPKRTKTNKGRKKGNRGNSTRELPPSAITYRGPIISRSDIFQVRTSTLVFHTNGTVASDGAGLIATVINNNPNGCPGWSSMASTFDEYRVLGMKVRYEPNNQYDLALSTTTSGIYTVLDHNNSAALVGEANAAEYSSCILHNASRPFSRTIMMSDVSEAVFVNTSSPTASFYIKFASAGNALTTTYGKTLVTFRVQFRGKGI